MDAVRSQYWEREGRITAEIRFPPFSQYWEKGQGMRALWQVCKLLLTKTQFAKFVADFDLTVHQHRSGRLSIFEEGAKGHDFLKVVGKCHPWHRPLHSIAQHPAGLWAGQVCETFFADAQRAVHTCTALHHTQCGAVQVSNPHI